MGRKVVINTVHGGFRLSDTALKRLCEIKKVENFEHFNDYYSISRDDLDLIQVIEELGSDANGKYSSLKIIEIPEDVKWYIEEYDGLEWVSEIHRIWR